MANKIGFIWDAADIVERLKLAGYLLDAEQETTGLR
jgi:hypothetical protein